MKTMQAAEDGRSEGGRMIDLDEGMRRIAEANRSGTPVDLHGANLSWADLHGTYLSRAELSDADLSGVELIGADLSRAELSDADLSWADLSWANLSRANLSRANLSRANLRGADLRGTGVIRIYTTYEATIYPDGRLAYGCECHQVDDWPGLIDALCQRHEPSRAAEYRAEIEAILALARVATTACDSQPCCCETEDE